MAVADHQTAGRGRRGRTWSDEPGQALMFSLLLRPEAPTVQLAPLALVLGIAVAEALPVPARLRWPNDVVVGGAKLAGILTELETPAGGGRYVVAGIGINVNTPADGFRRPTGSRPRRCSPRPGERHDRLALLHAVRAGSRPPTASGRSSASWPCSTASVRSTTWPAARSSLQLGDGLTEGVAAGVDVPAGSW